MAVAADLQGPVLTLRPKKSAHGYEKVWLPEGSPLAVFTERQAAALAQKLPEHIIVRHAMTYGEPSVPAHPCRIESARRRPLIGAAALPAICRFQQRRRAR